MCTTNEAKIEKPCRKNSRNRSRKRNCTVPKKTCYKNKVRKASVCDEQETCKSKSRNSSRCKPKTCNSTKSRNSSRCKPKTCKSTKSRNSSRCKPKACKSRKPSCVKKTKCFDKCDRPITLKNIPAPIKSVLESLEDLNAFNAKRCRNKSIAKKCDSIKKSPCKRNVSCKVKKTTTRKRKCTVNIYQCSDSKSSYSSSVSGNCRKKRKISRMSIKRPCSVKPPCKPSPKRCSISNKEATKCQMKTEIDKYIKIQADIDAMKRDGCKLNTDMPMKKCGAQRIKSKSICKQKGRSKSRPKCPPKKCSPRKCSPKKCPPKKCPPNKCARKSRATTRSRCKRTKRASSVCSAASTATSYRNKGGRRSSSRCRTPSRGSGQMGPARRGNSTTRSVSSRGNTPRRETPCPRPRQHNRSVNNEVQSCTNYNSPPRRFQTRRTSVHDNHCVVCPPRTLATAPVAPIYPQNKGGATKFAPVNYQRHDNNEGRAAHTRQHIPCPPSCPQYNCQPRPCAARTDCNPTCTVCEPEQLDNPTRYRNHGCHNNRSGTIDADVNVQQPPPLNTMEQANRSSNSNCAINIESKAVLSNKACVETTPISEDYGNQPNEDDADSLLVFPNNYAESVPNIRTHDESRRSEYTSNGQGREFEEQYRATGKAGLVREQYHTSGRSGEFGEQYQTHDQIEPVNERYQTPSQVGPSREQYQAPDQSGPVREQYSNTGQVGAVREKYQIPGEPAYASSSRLRVLLDDADKRIISGRYDRKYDRGDEPIHNTVPHYSGSVKTANGNNNCNEFGSYRFGKY